MAQAAAGQAAAIATASSRVAQSTRKNPPTISLASANGPSTRLCAPVAHLHPHALGVGGERLDAAQHTARLQAFGKGLHLRIGLLSALQAALGALAGGFDDQQHVGHRVSRWLAARILLRRHQTPSTAIRLEVAARWRIAISGLYSAEK